MGELGRLPKEEDRGAVFTFGGYAFEIVEASEMVVEKVRMYKLPGTTGDEG